MRLTVGVLLALTLIATASPVDAKDDDVETSLTGSDSVAIFSAGSEDPFGGPLERIGVRDSKDGVALRVYVGSVDFPAEPGSPFPVACLPDRQIAVQASTKLVAGSQQFFTTTDAELPPQGGILGLAEGAPVGVVVAQVGDDVESVRMKFADGTTDTMEPLADGWVVLGSKLDVAQPEPADQSTTTSSDPERVPLLTEHSPFSDLGRYTQIHDDGSRTSTTVSSAPTGFGTGPGCGPSEEPLPEPTGPPPADEAAAKATIRKAFTTAYEGGTKLTPQEHMAAVEGGAALEAAVAEARDRYPDVGEIRVKIHEIKFLDETTAAVRYDLLIDGSPITAQTVGSALVVDGTWKVARATYCEVLARGNIDC